MPRAYEVVGRGDAVPCPRCSGTGKVRFGTKLGTCYACRGKGVQDSNDYARNRVYWRHRNATARP